MRKIFADLHRAGDGRMEMCRKEVLRGIFIRVLLRGGVAQN